MNQESNQNRINENYKKKKKKNITNSSKFHDIIEPRIELHSSCCSLIASDNNILMRGISTRVKRNSEKETKKRDSPQYELTERAKKRK